jgi:hypothetical protein
LLRKGTSLLAYVSENWVSEISQTIQHAAHAATEKADADSPKTIQSFFQNLFSAIKKIFFLGGGGGLKQLKQFLDSLNNKQQPRYSDLKVKKL